MFGKTSGVLFALVIILVLVVSTNAQIVEEGFEIEILKAGL